MTGAPAHGQDPIENWLAARHRDLCDGLSQFLDPDAGLRETTTLHAEHADLLGALDDGLDIQAGLTAILTPPAAPQTTPSPAGPASTITAADPALRMALRRNPITLAAIISDLTVRALMIARESFAADSLDRARAGDLSRALDLAAARDRDLDRARDRALDLTRDFTHDRALVLAADLADNLAVALRRARDFEHARQLDLGLDRDLDDRGLPRDLVREVKRNRDRDHAFGLDFVHDLVRALDHAFRFAVDDVRDRDLDHAFRAALGIADQTVMAMSRALGVRLDVGGLAAALLEGALDDFTHADLTHADLTGCDLTYVRWSDSGTRWPPGTDVDQLRTRSREVAPGAGIYVVASPGGSEKALRHAPS